MEITASMVKELREATGAGMMDCKRALQDTQGDMKKAIDHLREKGLAAAAKKASRIAAEGLVASHLCAECCAGVLVEVNCETDFVAKTDEFKELVSDIALEIMRSNPADVEALLACAFHKDEATTVAGLITAKVAKIGEKITVRRFVRYAAENGYIDSYIHMGGKVGVLVEMAAPTVDEGLKEATHDIALQIAAASPVAPEYVCRAQVDPAQLEHEKDILIAQARNEGKPEKLIERMVEGRIVKFYKEVCLLEQPFVKDPDLSVETMLKQKAKDAQVVRFTRYKMGEGLEKKVNDLAAEVAAQTAGAK